MGKTNAGSRQPDGPVCPMCDRQAWQDDEFCANCGAKLPTEKPPRCPSCQGVIEPGDSFCGACGAAVSLDRPAGSAPPAQAVETGRPVKRKAARPRPRTRSAAASEAKRPARRPRPAPLAPEPKARPSRFLPHTRGGRIALAVSEVLAAVLGLVAEDGHIGLAIMAAAMLFCLFVIWRNILIGFGLIGPPRRPRPGPAVAAEPRQSEGPSQGGDGKSGTLQTVVMVVVVLAGIALIRSCGRDIARWVEDMF